jgi:hypothetical protein
VIQTVTFTPEDDQPQYFNQSLTLFPGDNVLGEQGMKNLESVPGFQQMVEAGVITIQEIEKADQALKDLPPKK